MNKFERKRYAFKTGKTLSEKIAIWLRLDAAHLQGFKEGLNPKKITDK